MQLNGQRLFSLNQSDLNQSENKFNHEFIRYFPLLYVALCLGLLALIFSDGLMSMLASWKREEFSHGYLIPVVSLYLMLQKFPKLAGRQLKHQAWGVPVLLVGVMGYFLGELSSIYTLIQYGFIIALVGVAISVIGGTGAAIMAVPLGYLLFMVPLPNFLYVNLSSHLQLLSSALGVFLLRLLDVSVFLEGNVIDLGSLKLQVVDACSGLRYLFPLMSFGFLVATLYRAAFWKRSLLFLSTIPITIMMNSFRIMVIGLSVNTWGISAAEGFMHDFQGWVVFMACLGLLVIEMMLIHRLSGNRYSLLDDLSINLPSPLLNSRHFQTLKNISIPMLLTLLILIVLLPIKSLMIHRSEQSLPRLPFSTMPLSIQQWIGQASYYDQALVSTLKFDDYLLADFVNPSTGQNLNLYMAYYQSQRKGASVHSPKTCLPGSGWQIEQFNQVEFNDPLFPQTKKIKINRVLMQKGEDTNLVYYWFQQRGRVISNEYLVKWFIFWDGLIRNRTDGALVRVIVNLKKEADINAADQSMQDFIHQLAPLLPRYIPE